MKIIILKILNIYIYIYIFIFFFLSLLIIIFNYLNFIYIIFCFVLKAYDTLVCSATEFFYSFRETKSSPYPEYDSEEALIAIKKLNEIKEKLSSG